MAMDNINNFIKHNSKYKALQKPLEAAEVCNTARQYSEGGYEVISFRDGLLTLGTNSPSQSANLQAQSAQIIDTINKDLGQEKVKKIRFKIV